MGQSQRRKQRERNDIRKFCGLCRRKWDWKMMFRKEWRKKESYRAGVDLRRPSAEY